MTIGNASITYVDNATALQDVTPTFTSSGNMYVSTSSNGTDFVYYPSQACSQFTIANYTGTTLEVQQDGTGSTFPIFPSTYYTFFGITNTNQIGVRRLDNSKTPANSPGRWEA